MNGIVLVNKPANISSNTVVNIVKRSVGAKKAGHLGTLDVLGEGVLPVAVGKATRLFNYFLSKTKTYIATFAFGFETETLDAEGKVTKEGCKQISLNLIKNSIFKFIGKQFQLPPNYSSKKIGGVCAYKLARSGKAIPLNKKEIEIFSFKLIGLVNGEERIKLINRFYNFHEKSEINYIDAIQIYKFEIVCSSGTYIRSLCRDFAQYLGTYGTMLSIIRTKCGDFDIKNAQNIEEIKNGNVKIFDIKEYINLPELFINDIQKKDLIYGKCVIIDNELSGEYKLFCNEKFLGIGLVSNEKTLKIKTYLAEE